MLFLILKLKQFLLRNNFFLSRTVSKAELKDFFNLIVPVSTNFKLIRIGSASDGGYLIPDDLEGVEVCFSPGVSFTSDFELEMADRGVRCFMADYSVDGPQIQHKLFSFEKKFIGSVNDDKFMTMENWVLRNAPDKKDMILQMDIEGAEFETIINTPKEILQRFKIIIVEFHHLDYLVSKLGYILISQTFRKILEDFEIVHIHPNNIMKKATVAYEGYEIPPVLEITFLRKDRITSKSPNHQFPHPLDTRNSLEFEDHVLPKCWFNREENY